MKHAFVCILAGLIGFGFVHGARAQTLAGPASASAGVASARQCGTLELSERDRIYLFWFLYNEARRLPPSAARARAAAAAATIPVAFHVIHDGANGRVPQEDVEEQIDVLNQAYAPISFVLASLDYTDNAEWFDMRSFSLVEWQAKTALQRDPNQFLNVYTIDTGDRLLGWAGLPYIARFLPALDGVTVLYSSLPNGSEAEYNQGDTLVHEVGHWAGLFHTFGLGFACSPIGDLVADTPVERTPGYDCTENRDTCPLLEGNDPIHNYMDYSGDTCSDRFTMGQFERMNLVLSLFRPEIVSP